MGIFDKLLGGKGKANKERLDVSARFRLDRHAFTGTMSKFHVAQEIGTNKLFGIKFLDDEKTAYFNSRFKGLNKPNEGEIALQIHHPHIVETYEYGTTTKGEQYILMEYINGPGLDISIRKRDASLFPDRMKLIREMADSIQAVHDQGFIHRDVCPRNFICYKDFTWLKLIDFGLTVPNERPYKMPGNRTGTPQYMAPEIVRRRETNQKLDVFSFGVTVYRFLTFEHPWRSTDTTGQAALAHDTSEVTPILEHRPDLNQKLAKAIHKCLEPDVNKRMDSCKKFLTAIRQVKTETE
ncbi:MAG: serine/threonine-protein kinase [Mariniblastus sp.]|jgi:eukaryotic-like serine/threonine-protein kinase|nr:serine/threonine protein kinase [Mariniblastus sp.]MDC0265836.1 serine/threonine protein kinase [Mariniblastus sp.]MDC0284574.1 serine/threonine protein kinase [Mariniblastus sp.]MDG1510527.1 serine/threonine-protein kinase [Mariniblastus sp.]MDG2181931.1 serine/threonine-protein kinase [Mariniblastus sp.]